MSFFQSLPPWLGLLLWTSFAASLLALAMLALIPALGNRVPARWRFALWLLVLIRFAPIPLPASPFTIAHLMPAASSPAAPANNLPPPPVSPTSIIELPAHTPPQVPIATPIIPSPAFPESHATVLPAASPPVESTAKTEPAAESILPSLLATAYLTGAAVVLLRLTLATLALRRIVRRAQPATDPALIFALDAARMTLQIRPQLPLLVSNHIASPALVGIFRPRILLPANLASQLAPHELRHILLHECAHYLRRDVLWNYLMAAVSILHWFNPIVWLILPRIRAERELATDERVLQHADPAAYGHTLLKLFEIAPAAKPRLSPAVVGILEQRTPKKSFFTRRIHMIATFKKRSPWLAVPALLTLAVCAALTMPPARAEPVPQNLPAAQTHNTNGTPLPPPNQPAAVQTELRTTAQPSSARMPLKGTLAIQANGNNGKTPFAAPGVLDMMVDDITADNQPLEQVLAYLRDKSKSNLVINWTALENQGFDRNAKISLSLKNVPLRKVLALVLDTTAGRSGVLGFNMEDNVILISTRDDLDSRGKNLTTIQTAAATQIPAASQLPVAAEIPLAVMDRMFQALNEQQRLIQHMAVPQGDPRTAYVQNDAMVRYLHSTRNSLEQEIAAEQAKPQASRAKLNEIEARITKVDQQLADQKARIEDYFDRAQKEQQDKVADRKTIIHDVREIIGIPDANAGAITADQRAAVEELAATLSKFVGERGTVSTFNGMLVINATDPAQRESQNILLELRERQRDRVERAKALGNRGN